MSKLIDLENVSESIIWGIVNNKQEKSDISDRIIKYLYSLPSEQKYDIDGVIEKVVCAANSDGYVKLDDALEIIRN